MYEFNVTKINYTKLWVTEVCHAFEYSQTKQETSGDEYVVEGRYEKLTGGREAIWIIITFNL